MIQASKDNIISIVTPSYNQGEFIERTLKSVIEQPGDFYIDYIVMDGKSTDQTVSILESCMQELHSGNIASEYKGRVFKKDNTGKYKVNCLGVSFQYFSEKDKGQTNAINKGWELALGSIIAWLNSDDVYTEGALNEVYREYLKEGMQVLYGVGLHIDKNDKLLEVYPVETYSFERLLDYCFICQPTVFLRRNVWESIGALNESLAYCMDYEYWLRIGKIYDFYFLNKTIACTRIHENTKTSQNLNVHSEIVQMQKRLVGRVSQHWIFYYAYYSLRKIQFFGDGLVLKILTRVYAFLLRFKLQ